MAKPRATWFKIEGEGAMLRLSGAWDAGHSADLEALLARLKPRSLAQSTELAPPVHLACDDVRGLDTLGAFLIHKIVVLYEDEGYRAIVSGLAPEQETLLGAVSAVPKISPRLQSADGAFGMLADIGEAVVDAGRDLSNGIAFFGAFVSALARLLSGRARWRLAPIVTQLERVALRGVPIIVLISFLVGAIIAQQSIFQLQIFGTVHFVADLLGILILRELALLLTAIMIAGRSGSSFTAELGSMKMREEIDALETMGLDPMEVLILPRILALIIAMPVLTFISSIAGIAGGALVAFFYGGVSYDVFFSRLQNAIGFNTFMVGMIKAPFMAVVVGLIACIEGLAVRGSAESLGMHTTASVVKSIFIVIVVDGLFAMFFAAIKY